MPKKNGHGILKQPACSGHFAHIIQNYHQIVEQLHQLCEIHGQQLFKVSKTGRCLYTHPMLRRCLLYIEWRSFFSNWVYHDTVWQNTHCLILEHLSRKSRRIVRSATAAGVVSFMVAFDVSYLFAESLQHTHGQRYELYMYTVHCSYLTHSRMPSRQTRYVSWSIFWQSDNLISAGKSQAWGI